MVVSVGVVVVVVALASAFVIVVKIILNVSQAHRKWVKESFGKSGLYLDAVDMEKKYEGKPEQLKNIFANSAKMTCPIRRVDLWEDPEYRSEKASGSMYQTEQKRQLSQDDKFAKRQKKDSGENKPEAGAQGKKNSRPLSEPQKKRADALLVKLQKCKNVAATWAKKLEEDEQLAAFMPHKERPINQFFPLPLRPRLFLQQLPQLFLYSCHWPCLHCYNDCGYITK